MNKSSGELWILWLSKTFLLPSFDLNERLEIIDLVERNYEIAWRNIKTFFGNTRRKDDLDFFFTESEFKK